MKYNLWAKDFKFNYLDAVYILEAHKSSSWETLDQTLRGVHDGIDGWYPAPNALTLQQQQPKGDAFDKTIVINQNTIKLSLKTD